MDCLITICWLSCILAYASVPPNGEGKHSKGRIGIDFMVCAADMLA